MKYFLNTSYFYLKDTTMKSNKNKFPTYTSSVQKAVSNTVETFMKNRNILVKNILQTQYDILQNAGLDDLEVADACVCATLDAVDRITSLEQRELLPKIISSFQEKLKEASA